MRSNSEKQGNPYIDARVHWNERYGYALSSAKNWRIIALIEGVALILLIAGYLYLSNRSTLVPYVLSVDGAGNTISFMQPEAASITDALIKTSLAGFIEDMHSITPDTQEQKKRLTRVYAKIANNTPAKTQMDELYNQVDYFETAKNYIVTTNINTVIKEDNNRYTIEWEEQKRKRNGDMVSEERKKASVSFELGDLANDERMLINNPIGIYVNRFDISKVYK